MITQKYINEVSHKMIGCAIEVHRNLGPGLLESVYETCCIEELINHKVLVLKHVPIPIIYKNKNLDAI